MIETAVAGRRRSWAAAIAPMKRSMSDGRASRLRLLDFEAPSTLGSLCLAGFDHVF
jgi:hypothetical protein